MRGDSFHVVVRLGAPWLASPTAPPADWKAADNLTAGSLVECTVPIGAYEITLPDGSTSTL